MTPPLAAAAADRPAAAAAAVRPAPLRRRWPRWMWLILLVGGFFRFYALNWDQQTLSHPDERHVLMAADGLAWPKSVGEYLDEARSPLNPRNRQTTYFAYGTLPTTLLTGLSRFAGVQRPEQRTLLGRGLSAVFDLGVVALAFLLGRALRPDDDLAAERTGLLAAALYALAVLPIQHAHFFVVDPFANFFVALTLWRLVRAGQTGRWLDYAISGAALGLAVACKISVATLGVAAVLAAIVPAASDGSSRFAPPGRIIARWLAFGFMAAVVFRLAAPDAFSGLLTPAPRWLGNMREVIGVTQGTIDIPFTRQWVHRAPLLFPWQNMVVWGMGVPLGLAAWAGAGWAAWRLIRRREWALLAPVVWIATVFLHQGTQWLMTLRYFLPIYAPLIALGAWALVRGAERMAQARPPWARWRFAPAALIVAATFAWAAAFLHVYAGGHTRMRASRWIYQHIPRGAALGVEIWDDSLPLPLPGGFDPLTYRFIQYPWYDADTPEKRGQVLAQLHETDYIILASDKLYGSIPRMPHRYPMTIAYYRALFDGSLGFDLVAQFRGTMNLLGWQFPTDSAEEAFSVYDHPRVMIFKKSVRYSPEAVRGFLNSVELADVTDTREPVPASAARPTAPAVAAGKFKPESAILIDANRWAKQQASGTWTDLFDRHGFVNRHALPCWAAMLALLWAIGFPYAFAVCGGLPDRGAGLCRLATMSVPLWLLWLLASGGQAVFRAAGWWALLAIFAVGAAFIAARRRAEMAGFLRREWRALLAGELVFWTAFAACLFIRWLNPDLWHPSWGGEKPMEMTYIYGVMKSDAFPPYNPWYAGGTINYYYFGFVLMGGLIKGMGVLPEIGFQLCLATLCGLTAAAAFSVVRAVAARCSSLWPALAGSAFVVLIGNLFQAKFIYERLVLLGRADHELTIPLVSNAIRAVAGLRHVLRDHQPLYLYPSDPYWVAARAIPVLRRESVPPITEFPCWSFIYADLHPHVIALPFTLALVGVLAAWCRSSGLWTKIALAAAMAFLLGFFWPTNTWDWPTYGALTGLTLFLTCWQRAPDTALGFLKAAAQSIGMFLLILIAGRLAFFPFYQNYVPGYGSFTLYYGEKTPFSAYLVIYGFFLFVMASGYWTLWRSRRIEGLARTCQAWVLFMRQWLPGGRQNLRRVLAEGFAHYPAIALLVGSIFVAVVALTLWMIARGSLPAFLCLGFLFSAVLAASRRDEPLEAMPFLMMMLGFALSLLVEFVVLVGDVDRMNTVFKFYYQVWVFFAVGSAALLIDIWRALPGWRVGRRWGWLAGFGLLLALAMLFPATAAPAKATDRFTNLPPSLDGLSFMEKAHYQIHNRDFPLRGDLRAIRWLQDNVRGTPVLLEMNTGEELYTWGSRFSIHTGLPSIVGWDWHQRQQQAGILNNKVAERIADVRALYSTTDPQAARLLLNKYHVGIVIVGELERAFAPEAGLLKFSGMEGLKQIYSDDGVTIYQVEPVGAR